MICRNCGAGLEADRIDTSLGVVTCSHCGSLHDIPGDRPDQPSSAQVTEAAPPKAKPKRLEVALPSRFKVHRSAGGMQVIWSVGGIFHGVVLSIIAAGFAHAGMTSGLWFLLIPSAGLFYFAAVRTFNKHRIRVDGARLQVTQGPLPWPCAQRLDASDVKQLYATEHESRIETGDRGNRRTRVRKHYRLSANTHGKGRVTILSGLSDPHQALWLEQEIERLLGIADTHVTGEHLA